MTDPPRRPKGPSRDLIVSLVFVCALTTLIGFVGYALWATNRDYQRHALALVSARRLHTEAEFYRAKHPTDACPTPDLLPEESELTAEIKRGDPWGTPYRIVCEGDGEIAVLSSGPDRKEGTADDLRVPSPPVHDLETDAAADAATAR